MRETVSEGRANIGADPRRSAVNHCKQGRREALDAAIGGRSRSNVL